MAEKIAMVSLGCAKNQVDAEQMLCLLHEAGYEITTEVEYSDVTIVNTCGFIESAKSEAIQEILELGLLKNEGKIGKILVTGCLPQRYKDQLLEELPEVDGILGCGSYTDIVSAVDDVLAGDHPRRMDDINGELEEVGRVLTTPEYYAYLKIAEGCDNHCAFCVIPQLRGKYRSRKFEDLIDEAKLLADQGVKELIVIAQDTSRYGIDRYGKRRLSELLRELCKIEGLHWIRVHYLYPDEMDEELIDTIAEEEKICSYLDIPIQHCNDDILRHDPESGAADQPHRRTARGGRGGVPGALRIPQKAPHGAGRLLRVFPRGGHCGGEDGLSRQGCGGKAGGDRR